MVLYRCSVPDFSSSFREEGDLLDSQLLCKLRKLFQNLLNMTKIFYFSRVNLERKALKYFVWLVGDFFVKGSSLNL